MSKKLKSEKATIGLADQLSVLNKHTGLNVDDRVTDALEDEEMDYIGAGLCAEIDDEPFVVSVDLDEIEGALGDEFEIPGVQFDETDMAAIEEAEPTADFEINSIVRRFREWLKIIPSARLDDIKADLLAANPSLGDFELHKLATKQLKDSEKKIKLAHERSVSDENACRVLLHQYFQFDDKNALDIYLDFQKTFIDRQCLSDKKTATRRFNDVKRSVEACMSHYKKNRPDIAVTVEALMRPRNLLDQKALVTQSEASTGANAMIALLDRVDSSTVAAPIRSAADFISAITEDLSREPDQVRQRHCSDLAAQLLSAVNVTAALVKVAPDNAVFSANQRGQHPVDAMHDMLRSTGIDDSMISRYLRQWTQVQSVSQENVDRALAEIYKSQEFETVASELKNITREEIDAALAYGIDPTSSAVMQAVTEFVQNEDFVAVYEEALQKTKGTPAEASSKRKRAELANDIYTATARSLEVCSREYLKDYMRAPAGAHHYERECANGIKCICLVLMTPYPTIGTNMGGTAAFNTSGSGVTGFGNAAQALHPKEPLVSETHAEQTVPNLVGRHNQGFIAREFLLPSQAAAVRDSHKLPSVNQLCLLCNRYTTTLLYYDYMRKSSASSTKTRLDILQNHCVIIDQAREYDHAACLLTSFPNRPFTGIVKPFVAWSAAHYRYAKTKVGNVVVPCLVETAALDFQLASASATHT